MIKVWWLGWAQFQNGWCPYKERRIWTHTGRTREDEGRDCGDSSINTTTNHRNEERHEQSLSLSLRRNQVCGYLDLGLQPPKLKQEISLSHPVCMWYLIMAALESRYIRTQVLVALQLKMGAEAKCGSCVQSESLSGNGFGEERVRLLASGSEGRGSLLWLKCFLKTRMHL